MADCTCVDSIIDPWCPSHAGGTPWLYERSWHESGADVPAWVVPAAVGALVFVLTMVALAVVVM